MPPPPPPSDVPFAADVCVCDLAKALELLLQALLEKKESQQITQEWSRWPQKQGKRKPEFFP